MSNPTLPDHLAAQAARHLDTNGDGHLSAMEQVAMLGDGLHALRRNVTQHGIRLSAEQKETILGNIRGELLTPEALQATLQEALGRHLPGGVALLSQEQTEIIAPIAQRLVEDIPTQRR